MITRIHTMAGGVGFLIILTFWSSTVISELFTSQETIAAVKQMILYGMVFLMPALAIAGGSVMAMGRKRSVAALFTFHSGATFCHHLVRKDGLLRRLWF